MYELKKNWKGIYE